MLNTLLMYVRDRLEALPVSKDTHPELSEDEIEQYGSGDAPMVNGLLDPLASESAFERTLTDRISIMFLRPAYCWVKLRVRFLHSYILNNQHAETPYLDFLLRGHGCRMAHLVLPSLT